MAMCQAIAEAILSHCECRSRAGLGAFDVVGMSIRYDYASQIHGLWLAGKDHSMSKFVSRSGELSMLCVVNDDELIRTTLS
jgi:hypothetical protein